MKFLYVFLVLLCLPSIASAQVTHYVTPSGAGSQNGSDWNNAYAGLPASLVRGDTYVLAGGTYTAQPNLGDATSGTTYIHIRKAQAGTYNGVTYNDDLVAGWNPSFQITQAVLTRACTMWNFTTGYYDIDGVTPGSTFPPPSTPSGYGIMITPVNLNSNCTMMDVRGTNERIQHVAFVSAGQCCDYLQFAIAMYDADNSYIAYNYFINSQNHIRMLGSQNVIVEHNYLGAISYFSSHHGEQINMLKSAFVTGKMQSNTTIRYNWFNDSGTSNTTGQIIDLDNTGDTNDGVYVYGNVFLNLTGHNGVGSGNSSTPATLTNWKFYNNSFVNSIIDFSQLSTGSEFRNNLLYGSQAQVFAGSAPATRSNNYWNATSNAIGSGASDVASSEPTSTLFQNYMGADYRLGVNSQARNIGFTLPPPYNMDLYGVTRVPAAWDAGAFQTGGTVGTLAPPTNLSVTVN